MTGTLGHARAGTALSGEAAWAAALRAACEHPADAAAAWHASGGQVVGMLGWSAPRELVTAAGLLPVRLSPDRLAGLAYGSPADDTQGRVRANELDGGEPEPGRHVDVDGTPAAFGRELSYGTARLAAALLSGALGWIDFLLIGRDREDHTRLFYLLRELRRSGAAPDLVPVAFFDLLRLPSRTSARYNRQRAAELTAVIARWAGRPVTPAGLASAVATSAGTAHSLREINAGRTGPRPAIAGSDALAAAIAAQVLPAGQLRPLLDAAPAAGAAGTAGQEAATRVFLAGSGTDDLTAYQALEELGIAIVGEDHEWGDDGSEYPLATRDPLDGIVDRYHFAHGGAARAGLHDRVARTVDRVRAAAADGVLYLLAPGDEAAAWQLPALRDRLRAGIPLVPVRLLDPELSDPGRAADSGRPELREAGRRLLGELGAAGTASGAREARHG